MSAPPKTIHFISLGCAKNRVDTEVMLGVSDLEGYELVRDAEEADVIVVNTCGFIGPAKEESVDTVLEMARLRTEGRCEKLVVAGCLSQRYSAELGEQMPEVDHFLGSSDMLKLKTVLSSKADRMLVGNPADYVLRASDPRRLSVSRHSAFIKIAEGCNRTCSFCAIPSIRGKQRSRPVEDIVAEVRRLTHQGLVEANIVSQDTIAYGRDLSDRPSLADLLAQLAEVPNLRWIRLNYLYPEALDEELLRVFAAHPNVLPYIDMPLQHASDALLRRMRRGHGGSRLYRVVETLRRALPTMVFRTTFIVGHPGETDADFDALLEFVRWAEFDHVGVFKYSHEEGTKSGTMTDLPSAMDTHRRYRKLLSVQRAISRKKQRAKLDAEMDVLVDGMSDESDFLLEGRHWGQAPEVDGKVYLANGTAAPGTIHRVRVTQTSDYDLVADFVQDDGSVERPPGTEPRARRALRLV